MKKKIRSLSITLLLLFFAYVGHSQAINQVQIKFDCGNNPCIVTSPTKGLKYVKEGSTITVQYCNVNPFAISSNLKGEPLNASFNDGADALQSILTALGKNKNDTSANALPKTSDSLNKAMTFAAANTKRKSDIIHLKKSLDTITKLQNLVGQKAIILSGITATRNNIAVYAEAINNVMGLAHAIDTAIVDPTITSSTALRTRIQNNADFPFTDVSSIASYFETNLSQAQTQITQLTNEAQSLSDINTQIKNMGSQGKAFSFDPLVDSLSSSVQKLTDAYYGNTNVSAMHTKVTDIKNKYQQVTEANFCIPGKTTFFINDDELDLSDSLMLPNNTLYRRITPMRLISYGGTRIDFSLGVVVTTGNLNSTSYFIIKDTSGSGKATGLGSSRANSIGNFSPIIFVHFTIKCASVISPAISIGLNPDFSTLGNSKLLLGISGAFTQSNSFLQRTVLTIGMGAGQADVLKPQYNNINRSNADQLLTNIGDGDLTEKALRYGGFIGVSFNLANLKK